MPAAVAPSVRRKAPRHGPAFRWVSEGTRHLPRRRAVRPRVEGGDVATGHLLVSCSYQQRAVPLEDLSNVRRFGTVAGGNSCAAALALMLVLSWDGGRHCCVSCVIQLHSRGGPHSQAGETGVYIGRYNGVYQE